MNWQLPAKALHQRAGKGKLNVNVIAAGNEAGFSAHLPYWTPGWRDKLQSVQAAVQPGISRQGIKYFSYIANADAAWWKQPPNTQQHTTTCDRRLPRTFTVVLSIYHVFSTRNANMATLMSDSDMLKQTIQPLQRAEDQKLKML
jgi:hypothetical protein